MTIFETLKAMRGANPAAECAIKSHAYRTMLKWRWQIEGGETREFSVTISESTAINADYGYIASEIAKAKLAMERAK